MDVQRVFTSGSNVVWCRRFQLVAELSVFFQLLRDFVQFGSESHQILICGALVHVIHKGAVSTEQSCQNCGCGLRVFGPIANVKDVRVEFE